MKAQIFTLLGIMLDSITSENPKFLFSWSEGFLCVETNDIDIIARMILPLFGDENVEERYQLIENSTWFATVIKLSHHSIAEVTLVNNTGEAVSCTVDSELLLSLSDIGMDDSYLMICQELYEKCEFSVDKS